MAVAADQQRGVQPPGLSEGGARLQPEEERGVGDGYVRAAAGGGGGSGSRRWGSKRREPWPRFEPVFDGGEEHLGEPSTARRRGAAFSVQRQVVLKRGN